MFSSQSLIQIGGRVDTNALARARNGGPMPDILLPFVGQMSGFFFNDVRVFKLALEG